MTISNKRLKPSTSCSNVSTIALISPCLEGSHEARLRVAVKKLLIDEESPQCDVVEKLGKEPDPSDKRKTYMSILYKFENMNSTSDPKRTEGKGRERQATICANDPTSLNIPTFSGSEVQDIEAADVRCQLSLQRHPLLHQTVLDATEERQMIIH